MHELKALDVNPLRIATSQDNDALLDLMHDIPMYGDMVIETRRDPDFFRLYEIQDAHYWTLVYEQQQLLQTEKSKIILNAVGTFLVRQGYLDGVQQPVGYLGDLRTRGLLRERIRFPALYSRVWNHIVAASQCRYFLTAILASNEAALKALVNPRRQRREQPFYHLLTPFNMTAVHFLWPLLTRTQLRDYTFETATPQDTSAIENFLHRHHQNKAFGYCFDAGEFKHRLHNWPEYTLERTHFVRHVHGDIVALGTAWDAAQVKRYRVRRYSGTMALLHQGMTVGARLCGTQPLPPKNHDFRYFYVANFAYAPEHPVAVRLFLRSLYTRYRQSGYHFFTLPTYPEEQDVHNALVGMPVRSTPFLLYGVSAAEEKRTLWQRDVYFEMALA